MLAKLQSTAKLNPIRCSNFFHPMDASVSELTNDTPTVSESDCAGQEYDQNISQDEITQSDSFDNISTPSEFAYSEESTLESSSEDSSIVNRIGALRNMEKRYDEEGIVGYDVWGRPVVNNKTQQAAEGRSLDSFLLQKASGGEFYRTVVDEANGFTTKRLSDADYETVKNVMKGKPYDAQAINVRENITAMMADWNIRDTALTTDVVGPKRKYIRLGSLRLINKLAKEIQEGTLDPDDVHGLKKVEAARRALRVKGFDVWADAPDEDYLTTLNRGMRNIPPPKVAPPSHGLSYNPPAEFLTEDELANRKNPAFRLIPRYADYVRDIFNRCLDLYLNPRELRRRERIDPESLLPTLPSKTLLRPYPSFCDMVIRTGLASLNAVTLSPKGLFVATGGKDGILRIFELFSGRLIRALPVLSVKRLRDSRIDFLHTEISDVKWCPRTDVSVIACCAGSELVFVDAGLCEGGGYSAVRSATRSLLNVRPEDVSTCPHIDWETPAGLARCSGNYEEQLENTVVDTTKAPASEASENDPEETYDRFGECKYQTTHEDKVDADVYQVYTRFNNGVLLRIRHPSRLSHCNWHGLGDYVVAVSSTATSRAAISVHQLSKRRSQNPFKKLSAKVVNAHFHNTNPNIIVVTENSARVYSLRTAALEEKLLPGIGTVVSSCIGFDDCVLLSGMNARTALFYRTVGPEPCAKLRFHTCMVRSVALHRATGLVATCADDGLVQVSRIIDPATARKDPERLEKCVKKMIPCSILKGHRVTAGGTVGVRDVCWHPTQPWVVTCGGDGTIRVWK